VFTSRWLNIFGLALCVTAAATTPALVRPASASPAAPTLTAVGHLGTYLATARNPKQDHLVTQLTLQITGSHFAPGSKVRIAVLNTARWQVAARGWTYAQRATTTVICGHDFKTCARPNPQAGTISYRLWLSSAPRIANLLTLYRSAGASGMRHVILQ
jgi:hypothetical protein